MKELEKLWNIVVKLRSPEGCPWDRAQTNESLKFDLIEEAYEVMDAIERKDNTSLEEELGDMLFLVLLHLRIAEEEGKFRASESVNKIIKKMIERHPHVFSGKKYKDIEEHLNFWERSKKKGLFEGIPYSLPALILASKVQKRARRIGFDWSSSKEVLEKVEEELREVNEKLQKGKKEEVKEEIGDLLFAIAHLANYLEINPEDALREAVKKYIRRFEKMKNLALRMGKKIEELDLKTLEKLWEETKDG